MSTAVLMTPPFLQFFNANGAPLSNGYLYTYAAGTTTPQATYTDNTGTVAQPNPIQLDASGRCTPWLIGSYKFVVTDSLYNVVETTDGVTAFSTPSASNTSFFQSFSGNASTTSFTLSQNLGTDPNGILIFVSQAALSQQFSGTGSQTAFTLSASFNTTALQVFKSVPAFEQIFSGTGSQTVFTLNQAFNDNISKEVEIFVGNTLLASTAYTITSGTTLTFNSAPASGSNNIIVRSVSIGPYGLVNPSSYTVAGTTLTFTTAPEANSTLLVVNASTAPFSVVPPTAYTLNGTALTFASAPPTGTNNILVFAPSLFTGSASVSAAAAAASAVAAATSATTATTQAGIATTEAGIATTQAGIATTEAGIATSAAATATTEAGVATTQAGNASTSATAAAASAALAAGSLISSSTTSNTIASSGSKTWTIGTGLSINSTGGAYAIFAQNGTPGNNMTVLGTSYNSSTGVYTGTVVANNGSGTINNWTMSTCGQPGNATGALLITNNLSDVASETTAVSNLAPGLNGQTYDSTPSGANDALWIYSAAATAGRKIAVQDVFKTINGLTSKTTPVASDELVINDSAASYAPKNISLTALFESAAAPHFTPASTTSAAGLNVPPGTAPTSPNNGDIWTTNAGMYVRVNGSTVGPLVASGTPIVSVHKQIFTSSGTYTPTTGMLYCIVEAVGGGGNAGSYGASAGGGSGGAGAYARSLITAATIGASKSVTIGGAGGTTSLGTLVVAGGGGNGGAGGGTAGTGGNGGNGGTASAGDFQSSGASGGSGNGYTSGGPSGPGQTPSYFGGGYGSGGASSTSTGTGTQGVIIITEYCSQ